ncbi:CoA transferase [Povalibacter sp.]|uniref:CaiB/BaiF CoA transferase family protein n=1 Tax=Povalibacter sp. TaxID=1962978 RepID=UPI002F40FE04
MSQQPFEGLNVVEFGQFLAAPIAAQLLAEGGAAVVKVEPLSGDPMRSASSLGGGESRHFIRCNQGKRCLPLDLSKPAAKPVIEALLSKADVVLMNFRPGLAEKMGIAPEQLLKRFPRLIIGSVSGYGNAGPEASSVGQDIVLQARSGLMAANGRMIDGRPAACDSASVDTMGAVTLAFGVSSALLRRERTGLGGVIETSLLQAAVSMASTSTSAQLTRLDERDAVERAQMLEQLAAKRAQGASYAEQLESIQATELTLLKKMKNVYYTTFATQDSFIAVACGSPSLQTKFIDALGIVDARRAADFSGDLQAHYTNLASQVENMLAMQPSDHWVAILRTAGIPVSKVYLPIELFDDEHVKANKLFHSFKHPVVGAVTVVAPPLNLDEDGFRPAPPTNPFGSESVKILLQLGFSEKEIADLMAAGISHKGL